MMTTDQLFIKLPRDLQWEILEDFVGTHIVRYGKLMRKMILDINSAQAKYTLRDRPCYYWLYDHHNDEQNDTIFARWLSINFNVFEHRHIWDQFVGNRIMLFCRDQYTNDTIFVYRNFEQQHYLWKARFSPSELKEDSIVLPPFVKHTYPSYPFTTKKNNLFLSRLSIK